MDCRVGCGACCVVISITSPIPGMPCGKPAGIRCCNLTLENACSLFGSPERPGVCVALRPSDEMCGNGREEATRYLQWLEAETRPDREIP